MFLPKPRTFALAAAVATATFGALGCSNAEEHAQIDATMNTDGYALFAVENQRQQRNDVTLTVKNPDPNSTYVLIYASDAPKSSGWFKLDTNRVERCGGDLGPHCDIGDGFGYLVDVHTVKEGETSFALRDDRCGCDSKNAAHNWTGYWAVMRVERTGKTNPVTVDVWAKQIRDYAHEPDIKQLQ
jgi:hypothetical protein